MGYGDRGIFSKEQKRHGLSHNIASSQHHAFLSGNLYAASFQKLDHACRRTGHEAGLPDTERPHALGMKAVYILPGIDCPDHLILIYMGRQGELHQNPVYIRSAI